MRYSIGHVFILIAIGLFGCLEPFNPEISDSQDEFLIVDGLITDAQGPYTVKILKTKSFNDDNEFVSGAEVSIEEDEGLIEQLVETDPGIYVTNVLQGITGKSYRLNINYNGQQFQSTWETIETAPEIDRIYYEYEVRGTTDRDNDQEGLQFFVDNQGPENGTRYFRYEWIETWQFGVRWPSTLDYVGNDVAVETSNPLYICWKTRNSTGINIATTVGLTANVLSGHPLLYAPSDEERFTRRYSLLVKQYTMQEEEYTFWQKLKESNQELGSLFDKQPANVLGNVSSVTNASDVALGYFSASGSKEVRIFVEREDIPPSLTRIPGCAPLDSLLKADFNDPQFPLPIDYETALNQELEKGKFFYNFLYSNDSPAILGALLSTPQCSDCTQKGGDLTKPDFWDE